MPARRRTNFPGLAVQAVKELMGLQDDLARDSADLRAEAIGATTDTKVANYSAKFNERIRVLPPTAGCAIVFPASSSKSQNKWIEVLKLGGGTCTVVPTGGKVMGAPSFALTLSGFYYFQSDGLDGWWIQPSASGGLSPPVALTDLQTIPANTWLGNITGGIAAITANTVAQLKTFIGNFGTGVAGLVPNTSGGSATTYLNGAGGFTTPASSPPTVGAQSLFGNPTGAPAAGTDIAVGTESLVGRSSGNVSTFASAAQSTIIRAAGSLFFATCAANQVLGRNGSADLGFFNIPFFTSLNVQVFAVAGATTYTPTSGMKACLVIATGGGGGGGGADVGAVARGAGGGGGGAGGTGVEFYSAATIGASQSVTVGAAGTGGANTGGNGTAGGNTLVGTAGALMIANGGALGTGNAGAASASAAAGGIGGTATAALANIQGGDGADGYGFCADGTVDATVGVGGAGGASFWGGGGQQAVVSTPSAATTATKAGIVGKAAGSGGSGGADANNTTGVTGGNGLPGIIVVIEFI